MYLFDILLLGPMAFRNGIATILENKEILKVSLVNAPETLVCDCVDILQVCFHPQVVHNCREIAACLGGQFGVKLDNVFDTQVRLFEGSNARATWLIFMLPSLLFLNLTFSHLRVQRWQTSCASTQPWGASFPTELAR